MTRASALLLFGLALMVILAGCKDETPPVPFASANVTATLGNLRVPSGGSTILVVDARNNGTMDVTGSFEILPENNQVTVETRQEVLTIRQLESTGQRRYNLTAYANSIEQDILITVKFKDNATGKVIGTTSVRLNVYK